MQEEELGQSLGPAANHLNKMSHWTLKDTMIIKITASHTYLPLTEFEFEWNEFMEKYRKSNGTKLKI